MSIPFKPTKRYQLVVNGNSAYPLIAKKEDALAYLGKCQENFPGLPAKIIEVNAVNIHRYTSTPSFDGGSINQSNQEQ